MAVTVSSIAKSRSLTTLERVKEWIGITVQTHDETLRSLIDEASSAIESHCGRIFARQTYSETLPGYGDLELQLTHAPLISVSSVLFDSTAIIDYSLGDRDEGFLYRQGGWGWTAQTVPGLSGHQRWPAMGIPIPSYREPRYTVTYVAGYILPRLWPLKKGTISASSTDDSFNDSASGFPADCVAGDVIETRGFTSEGNLGRFKVVSATTAKIVVDATLTTEAASVDNSVMFPGYSAARDFYDVERACFETVKAWHLGRSTASGVVEKQARGVRVRLSESMATSGSGLPPSAASILRKWVR